MDTIVELKQKKFEVTKKQRAMIDVIERENRRFNPEESKNYSRFDAVLALT